MDRIPTHGSGAPKRCLIPNHHCHHHRHHHHHNHNRCMFLCHHHHHHRQIHCFCNCHRPANPNFASSPINPQFTLPSSFPNDYIPGQPHHSSHRMLEKHQNVGYLEEEEEVDDDEEPVFVLTDEWKEFFAKSEAQRKLKKKQTRKGKT